MSQLEIKYTPQGVICVAQEIDPDFFLRKVTESFYDFKRRSMKKKEPPKDQTQLNRVELCGT